MRKPELSFSLVALLIGLLLSACGGSQQSVTRGIEPDTQVDDVLQIEFLDVGQGDSILIITPGGRVVLLDAGTRQSGDDIVDDLHMAGVNRINLALVSHAHADHIGGFADVLDAFEVLHYGDSFYPHTSSMYADLLERVEAEGSSVNELHVGQRIRLDDEIEMRVLAPPTTYHSGTRSDVNANSLVVLLEYRDFTLLLMGDAEQETEQDIINHHLVGDIDVLKVAHHGSAYASTQPFLAIVRPEYAIISCGAGNSYGHPSPDTVERLEQFAVDGVYRTDLQGTITLETNGDWIHVQTERAPAQVRLMVWLAAAY